MFHPAPVSLGLAALPAAWAERMHPGQVRRADAADLDRYFSSSGHRDSIPAWPVVVRPGWRQRFVAWYSPGSLLAPFPRGLSALARRLSQVLAQREGRGR